MNKTLPFCILVLLITAPCFAQFNQTESLTIVTYYPSPSGVYRSLRLNPTDEPTDVVDRGVMYYNQTENVIKFRNDTGWVNMTGGGGGYLARQSGTGNIYFANESSNVGIGTTDPSQKLDVNGNILASGSITALGNITVSKNIKVDGDVCLKNGICLSQLSFNAVCGSAGKAYPSTSTSYGGDSFCGSGTPSPASPAFPAQGGSVSWTCSAINGNPISCSASRAGAPVNGVCGPAATTYPYFATALSGALCTTGIPSPAVPSFPAIGSSSGWSCLGINGGSSPSCMVSRSTVPFLVNGAHTELDCTAAGGTLVSVGASNQCRFNLASCPAGWTQYLNWSSTASIVVYVRDASCGGSPTADTGGHTFADIAIECITGRYIYNSGVNGCGYSGTYYSGCATRTQIGCY
jgi:hypothetical protein